MLKVPGTQCRLDNIDAAGRWVQDETFQVAGKIVKRVKGASAGNTMQVWRDLRASHPHLFANLQIMQQPAAVMDSVLMSWVLDDMGRRFLCSLWQRDLSGGGGFSMASRQKMQLVGQIPAWIAGKMTAALQITDTDFAFRLKSFAKNAKASIMDELKAKARQEGCAVHLKCGPYEVLRIVQDSLQKLEAATQREN